MTHLLEGGGLDRANRKALAVQVPHVAESLPHLLLAALQAEPLWRLAQTEVREDTKSHGRDPTQDQEAPPVEVPHPWVVQPDEASAVDLPQDEEAHPAGVVEEAPLRRRDLGAEGVPGRLPEAESKAY